MVIWFISSGGCFTRVLARARSDHSGPTKRPVYLKTFVPTWLEFNLLYSLNAFCDNISLISFTLVLNVDPIVTFFILQDHAIANFTLWGYLYYPDNPYILND